MAISWYSAYGGYNNTGPYYNVLLIGSPTNSINGLSNVSLDQARQSGHGRGVGFELVENNILKIYVSLVGVSVSDSGTCIYNNNYVNFGGNYNYFVKLSKSTDNGSTYNEFYLGKDVVHPSTNPLAYNPNWQLSAFEKTYTLNLSDDITNIKFEIYGEDATFPHKNVFTREQILKDAFKPWGLRRGTWKSLTVGFFKKRTGGQWLDRGQIAQNKIRKSGTWNNQGKIGN